MLSFDAPTELQGGTLETEIATTIGHNVEVALYPASFTLTVDPADETQRDDIQAVIDDHVPPDPPPDPDEELASAIKGADNFTELKDALLGNLSKGRVAGRPSN